MIHAPEREPSLQANQPEKQRGFPGGCGAKRTIYIYSTCQIYKDMLIYIENTNVVDDTSHITPLLLYIYIYTRAGVNINTNTMCMGILCLYMVRMQWISEPRVLLTIGRSSWCGWGRALDGRGLHTTLDKIHSHTKTSLS